MSSLSVLSRAISRCAHSLRAEAVQRRPSYAERQGRQGELQGPIAVEDVACEPPPPPVLLPSSLPYA